MSKKKAFLLRMDPQLAVRLQEWARQEFRSLNGQIQHLLRNALDDHFADLREPGEENSKGASEVNEAQSK